MSSTIVVKNARGSFLTLGAPEYFGGKKEKPTDKARWSATALIAYSDPQVKAIDDIIVEVARAKWEKKWQQVLDNILADPKACFKVDGKRKDFAGYAGHWALTAHRNEDKQRPVVIDSDKSPIYMANNELVPGKAGRLYSGVVCNVQIEIWAQDNANGKAIRATLMGVQRVKDAPAFAGGAEPDPDAFEAVEEETDDLG